MRPITKDLHAQIIDFIRRNPGDTLTSWDASIKFDRRVKTCSAALTNAVRMGLLKKHRNAGNTVEYGAGPVLLAELGEL